MVFPVRPNVRVRAVRMLDVPMITLSGQNSLLPYPLIVLVVEKPITSYPLWVLTAASWRDIAK
jgi:hypothetical protein